MVVSSVMLKTNGFGSMWQSLGSVEGQMLKQEDGGNVKMRRGTVSRKQTQRKKCTEQRNVDKINQKNNKNTGVVKKSKR